MSIAGLLGALYVYMTYACVLAFPRSLLFILLLFPLPPSLGCRLPSPTVALQSVAGGVLGQLGGEYSSFAGLKLSVEEAGQPAVLTAGRHVWRPSLCYIGSLFLSRFSCGRPFCLSSC